ncbi:MAG: DUF3054 domain-containing protein [Gaiellaceae bacterium]
MPRAVRVLPRPPALAALADAVAILLFVTIGLASHGKSIALAGYARDALPLLGCWEAAALAFGLYRRPTRRAFLTTWLVGIGAGVGLRALVVGGSAGEQATFLAVALAFTLLFLVAARATLSLARIRSPAGDG